MEPEAADAGPTERVKASRRLTKDCRSNLGFKLATAVLSTAFIGTIIWASTREVLPEAPTPPASPAKAAVVQGPPPVGVMRLSAMTPGTGSPVPTPVTPAAKPPPVARTSAPVPALLFFDIVHPEHEEAEKAAALLVLAQFRTATTWQEKLRSVRQPDRVRPLMQTFYETHLRAEPESGGPQAGCFVHGNGTPVLHLACTGKKGGMPSYADLVRQPDGRYLLDWESFVGAGDMDWDDLKQARPTQPQLLRCLLSPRDYFNYEFTDERRYLSLLLANNDGELFIHAYCERKSDLGKKVVAHLQTGHAGADRVTVRVAFPDKAQSDNCVRLVELVADRWLTLE